MRWTARRNKTKLVGESLVRRCWRGLDVPAVDLSERAVRRLRRRVPTTSLARTRPRTYTFTTGARREDEADQQDLGRSPRPPATAPARRSRHRDTSSRSTRPPRTCRATPRSRTCTCTTESRARPVWSARPQAASPAMGGPRAMRPRSPPTGCSWPSTRPPTTFPAKTSSRTSTSAARCGSRGASSACPSCPRWRRSAASSSPARRAPDRSGAGAGRAVVAASAAARARGRVAGRRIEVMGRRGKYLIVGLEGERLLVMHLRMTGNCCWPDGAGGAPALYESDADARLLRACSSWMTARSCGSRTRGGSGTAWC